MSKEKLLVALQNARIDKDKINVDLSLISDVEKLLDRANSQRRQLVKMGLKISNDLNELQADYAKAFMLAKKAENNAKELGADDLVKLFGNRGDEAKDYQNAIGKAANKLFSALKAI